MCSASFFKAGIVFLCFVGLIGCGGGGSKTSSISSSSILSSNISSSLTNSSSSSSSNILSSSSSSSFSSSSSSAAVLIPQSFDFEQSESVTLSMTRNFTNIAIGQGNGMIIYSSDNPDIAQVDNMGKVSAFSPGVTIITATITADTEYLAATASYTLKVLPRSVSINAWIGEVDTIVEFPPVAKGFEFYRTSQENCDISTILECEHGQVSVIDDVLTTDTAVTESRKGYYTIKYREYQDSSLVVSGLDGWVIETDSQHDVLVHDNQMWLFTSKIPLSNDSKHAIWTSTDGVNWFLVEISEPSNQISRNYFNVVSFGNNLWMIAGDDSANNNDERIYSLNDSPNGYEWTPVASNTLFSPRNLHQSFVFNNKLWVIGGNDGVLKNDIWSSVNGSDWIEESSNAPFTARQWHQVIVFGDKLWLIGGDDGEPKNDIWSSVDGINWIEETANASFSPRYGHQVVNFNGKLWLMGGKAKRNSSSSTLADMNDIWSSADGVNWVREVEHALFSRRYSHQLVNFNEKLFLIGGHTESDVWSSSDGIDWRQAHKHDFLIKKINDM